MGKLFYKLSLLSYRLTIWLASFFNEKAKKILEGQKDILIKVKNTIGENSEKIVWFHCASLGEFEQGRPIMEQFKHHYKQYKLMLTFFSPSGYEVRKNYELADYVFYLPWDNIKNASKFIKITNPNLVFFIKYEFWHFYICELKKNSIPFFSVSSIFRTNQIYFHPWFNFYKNILKKITHFFVQNEYSKSLLEKNGIKNITVSGDTRFDRVSNIASRTKKTDAVKKFKNNEKIMVIGSCWEQDLNVLTPFINDTSMKFIIAPHEIGGNTQKMVLKTIKKKTILFSNIKYLQGDEDVLLINNLGLLSSLYQYGEFAFIGGGFGSGLHNILEAAVFGIPIFFGNKNYKKFNEAQELVEKGGAKAIKNSEELNKHMNWLLRNNHWQEVGKINKEYVSSNKGATKIIMEYCHSKLKL